MRNLLNFHSPVFRFQDGGEVPPMHELYQQSSDPQLSDILGTEGIDVVMGPEYEEKLWEYDPFQELSMQFGARSDIDKYYAGGQKELYKSRQGPTKASGFAGAGSTLLDMTTKDIYKDVGAQSEARTYQMMQDIYGERQAYADDIVAEVARLEELKGSPFETDYQVKKKDYDARVKALGSRDYYEEDKRYWDDGPLDRSEENMKSPEEQAEWDNAMRSLAYEFKDYEFAQYDEHWGLEDESSVLPGGGGGDDEFLLGDNEISGGG